MSKGSKNDGSDNEEDEDEVATVGAFVAEGNDEDEMRDGGKVCGKLDPRRRNE